MGKQAAQRLDRQRFNLSKLNDLEIRKQYQIDITNRFVALENIKENIKTSAKEPCSLGEH